MTEQIHTVNKCTDCKKDITQLKHTMNGEPICEECLARYSKPKYTPIVQKIKLKDLIQKYKGEEVSFTFCNDKDKEEYSLILCGEMFNTYIYNDRLDCFLPLYEIIDKLDENIEFKGAIESND